MIKTVKTTLRNLLLKSQKHMKADMLYIARGSFWLSLAQGLNGVFSFVLLIAFANLLSKDTYGLYRYILSIAGIMNVFALTGIGSAITQAVASGNENALRGSFKFHLHWNLMMTTAFLIVALYFHIKNDELLSLSFLILGIFVPITHVLSTYGAFLAGKKEFKFANISSIFSTLFYVLGSIITLLLTDSVEWLIFAYAICTFIPTAFFYFLIVRKYNLKSKYESLETTHYAKKLSFINIIGPIISQIDKIVLVQFWGPAQLATYALASALPSRIEPALKKFMSLGAPKFAEKTPEEINKVFFHRIIQGISIGIVIASTYILLAPFIFKYLLPQYQDGVLYSQILAIGFIFAMPVRYIGLILESQKMSRHLLAIVSINSSVIIVLYVLCGALGGILGLVIAHVLWCFISFCVNVAAWKIATRTKVT